MTNTFWIAATGLILLALAFILYPVLFHRPEARARADLRNQNLLAYRTRMKELEQERDAGILDEENYQLLKEELAGALLDDVAETDEPAARPPRAPGRRSAMAVALVSILLLPAGVFLLYQKWGAMDRVEQFLTMQEMQRSGAAREARMAELVEELRAKLEASPDNPEGWAMLGQSYMRLERYTDAAWAFRQLADSVAGDDNARAVALGLAAQALFFDSRGDMTEDVIRTIEQARALNPDEVNSLGLLGIHAFGREDYREAIRYWQRIVEMAPDHPQIASIRGGIEEAYQRLGETPPAEPAAGPGVTVQLSLADGLAGQIPPDTTLFVFAREAGNPSGPPLAVARLSAGDLPATVRLDDRMAMSPQLAISKARQVMVTARLSRSGEVTASAGDWQGQLAAPVAVSDDGDPVSLVIDRQLTN